MSLGKLKPKPRKEIAKCEGAARCAIVEAEAEAKANILVAQSITAQLVQWQAVRKWDGRSFLRVSGEATPFINLK